jgi:hypothetical protein
LQQTLISFFFREVEYHIQSNTNSKTIVLNNTIIHPNELTGIGMRGRCSERVSISCFTSGTRRVNLVTNPVISHERGKDRKKCLRQVEHIRGHL